MCDTCTHGKPTYTLATCGHSLCISCVNGNLSHDLVFVHVMVVECPRCKQSTKFDVKTGLPPYHDGNQYVDVQYLQAHA